MKNLTILLLFLITNFAYCQFDLTANQTNGKYSQATNNATFMGISSGNVVVPTNFVIQDTSSNWTLLPNQTNGKYSIVTNAVTFMGKSAGTVQIPISFNITANSIGDSSIYVKRSAFSQSITATGGDMDQESTNGNIILTTVNGDPADDLGTIRMSASGKLDFISNGGGITFNSNDALNDIGFSSNRSISFTIAGSGNYVFNGMPTLTGGVTPATFDGYIKISLDGVNFIKVPFINIP